MIKRALSSGILLERVSPSQNELKVIKARYLNSTQGQPSLAEVGERLGISRQRVISWRSLFLASSETF